jgi:hypothetical protein
MNMRLLNLVVRTHQLKGAAYQVMLALAWNSGATNECSISISDIAADAHLTKKSVISALQFLTSAHSPCDRRSILTKAKQGIGVGIPSTYLIDLELLRDLNRRRRLPPATRDQGRRVGDTPTPGRNSTNVGEAGNGATLAERREVPTLRGQIKQNETETLGLIALTESKPLPKREVNRILKAHVKQVARDISAIVNGSKEIVPTNQTPPSEVFEVAASSHDDNKTGTKLSGELISGPTRILGRPLSGISGQRLYRSVGASSSEGVEVLPVNSYPAGICWPRRLR